MTVDKGPPEAPEFLTVEEVAALLRVEPGSVRRWFATGRLASYKFGKLRLVRRPDLEAFIASCREAPGRRGRPPTTGRARAG